MGLLSNSELDDLMSKIGLQSFSDEIKQRDGRGRKPKDYYNHWFERLQDAHYYAPHPTDKKQKSETNVNSWVDDVLTGAGRLSTNGTRVSANLIFAILRGMPYLSSAEIKSWLNSKRIVLGGNEITNDRYCRTLMNMCLSALRSLDVYTDKGCKLLRDNESNDSFSSVSADAKGWEEHKEACKFFGVPVTTNLVTPLLSTREINTSLLKLSSTEYVDLETGEILNKMELIK